jgi:hypothetical protein
VDTLIQNPNPTQVPPPNPVSSVTDQQQADVYAAWLNSANTAGVNGVVQYQWSQAGLNEAAGGGVVTSAPLQNVTTSAPVNTGGTVTPDDGYGAQQGWVSSDHRWRMRLTIHQNKGHSSGRHTWPDLSALQLTNSIYYGHTSAIEGLATTTLSLLVSHLGHRHLLSDVVLSSAHTSEWLYADINLG